MRQLIIGVLVVSVLGIWGGYVTAQDKEVVRVGILPVLEHLPIVIAKKEIAAPLSRIKIDVDLYTSWTALEAAYRTGAVDAVAITFPKAVNMAFEGVPLQILLVLNRNGSELILKDDTASALKGKITGNTGNDTIQLYLFKKFIRSKNLRFGFDVRALLVPLKRAVSLFSEGRIFGFCFPSPYGLMAQKKSGGKIILSRDILPGHIDSVLIVRTETIQKKRAAIKELVRSLQKAGEFIENDKDESGGVQSALAQEDVFHFPKDIAAEALSRPKDRIVFSDMVPGKDEMRQLIKELVAEGIAAGMVNVNEIVNKRFVR